MRKVPANVASWRCREVIYIRRTVVKEFNTPLRAQKL
jgi:hypothetical protein